MKITTVGIDLAKNVFAVHGDHARDLFHRLDLRAHDVGAPLSQHLGDDVNLLAIENLAQLLPIPPGAGGSSVGTLLEQRDEVGHLREIEFVRIFE